MRLALATALLLFAAPAVAEETVRIAIVDGAQQIALSGADLEVRKLEQGERYAKAPGGRSLVYLKADKLMLDGAEVKDSDGVKFRSKGFVRCADHLVRGQIEIRRSSGKGLVGINVIPLEDYLQAVLGSEMPSSFPLEALKAQAVAARTYAVQRKIDAWGKPYHMGATVLNQVYGGVKVEDARTREAVKATAGEVLTFHMAPIEAYFHSSCGGRTESGNDALGRPLPYLKPVECACGGSPKSEWSQRFDDDDFKALVRGRLKDIRIVDRTPTGRARRVELITAATQRTVTGVELRRALGYDKLKSLSFDFHRDGSRFELSGKGFGHGAGMCQWGAKAYAEQGWDYRKILSHYYDGAELRRMY